MPSTMALTQRLAVACVVLLISSFGTASAQQGVAATCAQPFQWGFAANAYLSTGNTPQTCDGGCENVRRGKGR
jgi:hypothetical protein